MNELDKIIETVSTLYNGGLIDDESGRQYQFRDPQMYVNDGEGFRPTSMDVSYILGKPWKFRRVE